jgi:hypothetical protein
MTIPQHGRSTSYCDGCDEMSTTTDIESMQGFMKDRMDSFTEFCENLGKINLKSKKIVLGKIELDVIFEGLRLMPKAMAMEFKLCYQILEHPQVGLQLLKDDKMREYEVVTQELWAAIEHTRKEIDGLAGSDPSTIRSP